MNLQDIVKKYLEENKFEGLWNEDGCGCHINDLFPCCEPSAECVPGHVLPCNCGDNCDYHIGPKEFIEGGKE